MRTARFRKMTITMTSKGRGQYTIEGKYRGRLVKVHSTDSETYDWLNDDSDRVRHQDAKRAAYTAITLAD